MKNLLLVAVAVFCASFLFGCNAKFGHSYSRPQHLKTDHLFTALPQSHETEEIFLENSDGISFLPVGSTITLNKIDKVIISVTGEHLSSSEYSFFYRVLPKEYRQSPWFQVESGNVTISVNLEENDEQWARITVCPNDQLRLEIHVHSLDCVK
jgi:hypothetical protein